MPLMMLSGFFVDLVKVVPLLWPFQWISTLKYAGKIMFRNEFEDNNKLNIMGCDGNIINTNTILEYVGVDLKMGVSFICLIALYILFLLIALCGLIFTTKRV